MNKVLAILAVVAVLVKASFGQTAYTQTRRVGDIHIGPKAWAKQTLRSMTGPAGNRFVVTQATPGSWTPGDTSYLPINDFALRLPSETVDTFSRNAVNAIGGSTFRANSYASSNTTMSILSGPVDIAEIVAKSPELGASDTGKLKVSSALDQSKADYSAILSPHTLAGLLTQQVRIDEPAAAVGATGTFRSQSRPQSSAMFGFLGAAEHERMDEATAEEAAPGTSNQGPPGADATGATWKTGQDVYVDMLMEMSRRENHAVRAAEGQALERLDDDPSERVDAEDVLPTITPAEEGEPITIRTLAGKGGDRFNRQMAIGDRLMAAGRFYQAAARYGLAARSNPMNPLPLLGTGVAYLGAGETYQASHYLRASMRMFPDLAKVRVDLDAMLSPAVVDKRLAETCSGICEPATKAEAPRLFVVTFIHANRGHEELARTWAARLAPLVEDDPRLKAYAESLLAETAPAAEAE